MKLLHFTATWCQPCKQMEPVISEFLSEYPEIEYEKIDVDKNFDLVNDYQVKGVPTFITLDNEDVLNRHTGVATKEALKALFF